MNCLMEQLKNVPLNFAYTSSWTYHVAVRVTDRRLPKVRDVREPVWLSIWAKEER